MGQHDKHCTFSGHFFFVKYSYNDTYINNVYSMICNVLTKK